MWTVGAEGQKERGLMKPRMGFRPEIWVVLWVISGVCIASGFEPTADSMGVHVEGVSEISYHDEVTHQSENTSHTEEGEHEHVHESFKVASFDLARVQTPLLISTCILIATLAKLVFHFRNRLSLLFPESCLLIIVGVIVGIILFSTGVHGYTMDSHTFFFYLLPPIILDAGYFMPNRAFFDNIGTILLYAIVGTLLNTTILGFSLWGFSYSGGIPAIPYHLDLMEVFTFAALLSAVDPVAVLAVFEEAHVNECLYIIVFGESLLNDGVTVVLYHMFEGFTEIGVDNITQRDVWAGIASFIVVAGGGTLMGIIFGFLAALMTRATAHVPVIQPLLVLIMGYLAYIFAEMFHLSGILACTFCGITMRKYVEANISKKSHTTTKYFLKLLASVSETVIFMYLGISTVTDDHHWDWGFCLLSLLFCLIIRAVGVLSLTALLNIRRLPKLGLVDQFIMSYGGLRGAIAFSLVIVLPEDLFPHKDMYITTTVLVVFFTNFVMGATIKPLVDCLKVPKSEKAKPSLSLQIHTRFIDHLMAGIEDISGLNGHHKLREKFEHFDKKYLQPIFIRNNAKIRSGWSIMNVFEKLNERDANELVRNNSSYTQLFSQLQKSPSMAKNFSFVKLLASIGNGHVQNGFLQFDEVNPECDIGEQTQIDLQAMEAQDTRKMRDDSKVHHILEDAMFMPRKRYTGNQHRRHLLCDTRQQQQLHHKAKLHLRHLVSQHHHQSCNGSNHSGGVAGSRPKKNVSFAEVTQVAKDDDTDVGSTKAESGGATSDAQSDSSSEAGGITFTVGDIEAPEEEPIPEIPVEPVAVEKSLPWKRNTGREPLSSAVTLSMPNDQHPLLGEAPSWVNNTEYTSPGSLPVTPQSQHNPTVPGPASDTSLDNLDLGFSNPALECSVGSDNQAHNKEVNLISLDTPDHKAALPMNREIPFHKQDDNHDRTNLDEQIMVVNGEAGNCMASINAAIPILSDKSHGNLDMRLSPPSLKSLQGSSLDCENNKLNGYLVAGHSSYSLPTQSPPSNKQYSRSESDNENDNPLPWRSNGLHGDSPTKDSPLPWRQDSKDSNDNPLPWRSAVQTEPETAAKVMPWRSVSQPAPEVSPEFPLPWRTKTPYESDPAQATQLPWRDTSSQCPIIKPTQMQLPWRSHSEAAMDTSQNSILPWRDNSNVEVKLDQGAPRPPPVASPCSTEKEVSHVPPPPWRSYTEPDCSIRSPSFSCEVDVYSLKPQLSSHSFRISEAESKHSEQVHVHHMIDLPAPRPSVHEYDVETARNLDLESEQLDCYERVMIWLMGCEPEPLEDNDLDLDLDLDLTLTGGKDVSGIFSNARAMLERTPSLEQQEEESSV